jgi:amidophosphoribosyltransferase
MIKGGAGGEIVALQVEQKPREECGVFGIWTPDSSTPVAQMTHDALLTLQHRGQDGAGIVVSNGDTMFGYRGHGLVRDAFTHQANFIDNTLPDAHIAVGQVRYGTSGASDSFEALQPQRGKRMPFALAHNGNVGNMLEVADTFQVIVDPEDSDTQIMTTVFDRVHADGYSLADTTRLVGTQMTGAFSLVLVDEANKQLIGARDPWGVRPLVMGRRKDGSHVLASETVALDSAGADFVREIEPGEVVVIGEDGITSSRIGREARKAGCYFEYEYFMDPESQIVNQQGELTTIGQIRRETGRILHAEHPPVTPPEDTIVVGIPASGMLAAKGYAEAAGLPLVPAVEKRKNAERSFIQPTQEARAAVADSKMIFYPELIEGKHIMVVDDSIVRGTSMIVNTEKFYNAGALSVHVRIPTPAYADTCIYGVNTGTREELIAVGRTNDQVRQKIKADSLGHVSPEGVERAINIGLGKLCMRCVKNEDKIAATPAVPLARAILSLGMPRLRQGITV